MGLPHSSVRRPVLTWMIFAAFILLGIVSLFFMPVELYQGEGRGIISIIIRARGGLAPIEVEHMITRPVEESVSTVSHLKQMFSNSREAESRVTLEFEAGTDMKYAALEVREKFSRVKSKLPDEIEKPVIANYEDSDAAVLVFAVASETMSPEEMREVVDSELKPRLDRVDGVASAEVYGGRERKILVELDRDKMFAYNISIERVMDVIGASNISLLAGSFDRGPYEFAVRTMGAFQDIKEIGSLGVKATRQGSIIPLEEIATIKDAYLEPEDYARLNLDQNVSVYVKKASLANTIKVVDRLKAVLDGYVAEKGGVLSTVIVSDKAKLIKRAIHDVRNSLFMGVLLVSAIIYLALRNWHLSLVVFVTIPISVVSTFYFMSLLGLSLNVMTLSGLALSIGILVDSAVVVIENTVKKIEEGISHRRAVVEGTEEMWLPLLASLATSLCVFLPVVFVDQSIKLQYQGFAFTVSCALVMSLMVAVMLVPVLLMTVRLQPTTTSVPAEETGGGEVREPKLPNFRFLMFKRPVFFVEQLLSRLNAFAGTLRRAVDKVAGFLYDDRVTFTAWMKQGYDGWIRASFRFRYLFLSVVLGMLVLSLWGFLIRDYDYPTQLEENEFEIIVYPLAGAKLDANDEVARRLEELLNEFPEVDLMSTTVQKHDLRVFVRLVPRAKRKTSKDVIVSQVEERGNELIKEVHEQYYLNVYKGRSEEGKKMEIDIFGLENDRLEQLAREIGRRIQPIPGLTNLVMTDLRKRPEYSVVVNKQKAGFYGLTVKDVADSIHAQVRGMRPTKFHELEKGQEIETITRLQALYRQKIDDLLEVYVVSPVDGTQVALKQIAGLNPSRGPQSIDRKNKYRYIFVKGDTSRPIETVANEIKAALRGVNFPRDYFWRFGGQYEDLMKGKSQLWIGAVISIVLIYMVLACLYQSYAQPVMIMISIPLAVIGVWTALWFGRKSLSAQVFLGIFILVGYVVNGAIILIDRINHLKPTIHDTVERLVQAGRDRLRPILMTTGSTVVGFIPMAFSRTESSELWSPLAITMIGGILSSTVLMLFVIPCIYLCFEDMKLLVKRFSSWATLFHMRKAGT